MAVRATRAGLGLAVGIIILAAAVYGGLWFARERGEQARRDEAVRVAQQNDATNSGDQSSGSFSTEGDKPANNDTTKPQDANGDKEGEKSNDTAPASNGASSAPSSAGRQSGEASNESSSSTTATELPHTGAESFVAPLGLGALVFTGASYLRSRRM